MTEELVLGAKSWQTNADLIADVAKLGYLDGHVLDPTYGRGLFWTKFQPTKLTAADLYLQLPGVELVDFTDMPYPNATFNAVVLDPPYVAKGGRSTSGIREMDDRYGQHEAPKTPRLLQDLIEAGIANSWRVLKPKGYLLVKCKDYISSRTYWNGTYFVQQFCIETLLMKQVDRFEMVSAPGRQPAHRTQEHARRNHSTLFVFRKKGR